MQYSANPANDIDIKAFLNEKSEHTLALFNYFVQEYKKLGNVVLHPTKTVIALVTPINELPG